MDEWYKLEAKDFIPVSGVLKYRKKNIGAIEELSEDCLRNNITIDEFYDSQEQSFARESLLYLYNLGVAAAAGIGIWQGINLLERVLH